ncbi:MAG TPA: hypothetical protein VNX28_18270 [Gemmataceae bacterium]|jgi:hypothetical protein|nr:hypothetical protein [Gemmataceae bacterium]
MRLQSFDYVEFEGTPRQWSISGLNLSGVNLLVGKNASGKTRTLNVIYGLAKMLAGKAKAEFSSGSYSANFEHDGARLSYVLEIVDQKVTKEEFAKNDAVLLRRWNGGIGSIYHEKEQRHLEFQAPESDLAAVVRMDTIQHRFLEPLRDWGSGVRHYAFGEAMGRATLALMVKNGPAPDPADVNAVIALFRKGMQDHPNTFADAIKRDMNGIGYQIEDIGVMAPTDLTVQVSSPIPVAPVILFVKENDLPGVTQQLQISQGMFRALSIIIHVNYAVIASKPTCLIIDDIGEGLDYERSCSLIELLGHRVRDTEVQLLMSTNDRFVMNNIPLEEWSVLVREGNKVHVRNYLNSKELFDEFKSTGLSNFSFLEMDFVNGPPKEELAAHE